MMLVQALQVPKSIGFDPKVVEALSGTVGKMSGVLSPFAEGDPELGRVGVSDDRAGGGQSLQVPRAWNYLPASHRP
jgi:hypothetical protein